jgi:hypothetical protein
VPCEAAGVFQQLYLKTTFMRGPEKAPGPEYFEATIKDINVHTSVNEGDSAGARYSYILLDRLIPNDDGFLMATLNDKRKLRFTIERLKAGDKPGPGYTGKVDFGTATDTFKMDWNIKATSAEKDNLKNAKVKVYLQNHFPPAPAPSPDLQRLNDNLDAIRLNILNQSLKP